MGDRNEESLELKINCRTWLKDTEDLFDFEASNISTNVFSYSNLDKDFFIIKYKDESDEKQKEKMNFIYSNLIRQKINSNNSTKILGAVMFGRLKTNLTILNPFKCKYLNGLYMPENCERLYELFPIDQYVNINEGDIIKIGRIRIKFDIISFKSKNKSLYEIISKNVVNNQEMDLFENNGTLPNNKNLISSNLNLSSFRNTENNNNINNNNTKALCRLCYQSESSIEDPLISPCNCSGSMKYIHLSCLKNSIKLKYYKKSEEYYDIFLFHNYSCEICLSIYPKYILYKTKVYFLIDLDFQKFENYVLCDLTQYLDNNQKISRFGYLMFKIEDDKELTLGRKKNNHIKLKDISVSRNHCVIIKRSDNLLIKDLGSKFGTMKYVNNYIDINYNENIKFLSGRHELEFLLVKSWGFLGISNIFKFSCCSCNQNLLEKSEIIIYGEDNTDKDNMKVNKGENNNQLKNNNYYSKFKDYDSYNDYIIKLDKIIGIDDLDLNEKDNKEKEGNENEESINHIKDKEESFTNS